MAKLIYQNQEGIQNTQETYDTVKMSAVSTPFFTDNLHSAAKWLKKCAIKSIAMESTGVYWIPVFQILDAYGFDVVLVNARHVKNVPGRKTDVLDCQWLQYLHSVGSCVAHLDLLRKYALYDPC